MKTLGCKVSDETYKRIKSLDYPISETLRKALNQFLKNLDNQKIEKVNHTETTVNTYQNSTYQTINQSSNNPQPYPEQNKTKEEQSLDQSSTSKNHDNDNSIDDTKTLSKNKNFNIYVNPYTTYDLYSQFKRYFLMSQTEKWKKYFPKIITDNTVSPSATFFKCLYCENMSYMYRKSRRREKIYCPSCKRRIYL